MRKVFLIFFSLLFLIPVYSFAQEAQKPLNVYFFYGQGCPHCAAEELYLDKLKTEYGDKINIYRYETWYNKDNVELLKKFGKAHSISVSGVPATFIGQKGIIGFDNENNIGQQIKLQIDYCLANGCTCPGDTIIQGNTTLNPNENCDDTKTISTVVNLPFIGSRDLKDYSLPALAVIIGILDGFNPCAMWVLIFLITLLLGMKSRSRMWLLGGTFIFASAAVYFLFMAAWLNFLMFLGYVQWIRMAIGCFGIISGGLFLREYWKNREGECKVVNTDSRKKVFQRLKDIVKNPNLILALIGIILLAFTVNLVELACSLGFPAIFTQILSLAHLPVWQYYGYILLYLFFFMLDDMLIFVLAMTTLKITGLSGKYTRYSSLIGGILIFIIGILLILKPEWLMFS
ncbi:MAG: thioredoxin family protein [Patescibacteria group bacterium]|jgi:thiol-disulfide isomerase/thioredoxin